MLFIPIRLIQNVYLDKKTKKRKDRGVLNTLSLAPSLHLQEKEFK
jgi:hypothetical protein